MMVCNICETFIPNGAICPRCSKTKKSPTDKNCKNCSIKLCGKEKLESLPNYICPDWQPIPTPAEKKGFDDSLYNILSKEPRYNDSEGGYYISNIDVVVSLIKSLHKQEILKALPEMKPTGHDRYNTGFYNGRLSYKQELIKNLNLKG